MDNDADLAAMKARAQAADLSLIDEGATTCCYARSDKHWVVDPQGLPWEHFRTLGTIPTFRNSPELVQEAATPPAADALRQNLNALLGLMAQGRSNAAIAAALTVSDGAVEKHISSIFTKLDLAPSDSEHRRVLAVLMFLIFQAVFAWAATPMEMITDGVGHLGAVLHGVGQQVSHGGDAAGVGQGAHLRAFGQAVAHFQALRVAGQCGHKFATDAFVHQKARGRDAHLPRVAELLWHRHVEHPVEIAIGKDQHRRMTAQFHRRWGDAVRAQPHQMRAHSG